MVRTQARPKPPVRDQVFVNAGNRYLEFISQSSEMVRMPNVIRKYDLSWEELPVASKETAIITRDGVTYAIGKAAKNQAGSKSAFDKGKLLLLPYSVFAAFEPIPGHASHTIKELKIAVPDTRNTEAKLACEKLIGTHEYNRNGLQQTVVIESVTPVEEATCAYRYGVAKGLYQWEDAVNGVIDFGGGTSSGRLYSAEGVNLRDASITLPGTNALAAMIQTRLLKETGLSVELNAIMDGIENGSYLTGRNGVSFLTHFASACEQWLDDIRSKARSQWSNYLADMGEILLVGGSASLAQDLVKRTNGRFKIVDRPQDVTVLGMSL